MNEPILVLPTQAGGEVLVGSGEQLFGMVEGSTDGRENFATAKARSPTGPSPFLGAGYFCCQLPSGCWTYQPLAALSRHDWAKIVWTSSALSGKPLARAISW